MFWGIVSLIIVGLSWTLAGVIMGLAPKKKIDPGIVQLTGSAMLLVAVAVLLCFTDLKAVEPKALFWCGLAFFMAGVSNCVMLVLMSHAMQKGPNGIIWAIIQSAMIFPFMTGILFFGVQPTFIRFVGLFMILGSLFLSGTGKKNEANGGNWKLLAFICFVLTGITQNMANLPSYFSSTQDVHPLFRVLCLSAGGFTGALIRTWYLRDQIPLKKNLTSKWMWTFNLIIQSLGIIFAVYLQYPSMDALARHGAGSLAYPLLVGSCVGGFSLYSMFILKEKSTPAQKAALLCCLAGIILICL